ncbi:MAG: endopeptidase La [Clostridiales bacterium]|nr:endopeptidase La [Clostridiales bacterium]
MPMLALRGLVLFPGMTLHFDVGRKKSVIALNEAMQNGQLIYLVTQKDIRDNDPTPEDLYKVGVVAQIRQVLRVPGDTIRVLVEGIYRARAAEVLETEPCFRVQAEECIEIKSGNSLRSQALVREAQEAFREYAELSAKLAPDLVMGVLAEREPGALADYIASNIMLPQEDKQAVLGEMRVNRRMERLLSILERENNILSLEKDIHTKVQVQLDQGQKEYYLREQMKIIAEELGDGDNPREEAEQYRMRILTLGLPEESRQKLLKETDRLFKMPTGSHEGAVVRGYLDACLELPWNRETRDHIDIAAAQKILDRDHYGLDKVKDRILEILAVRKLAPDIKGQIICLSGPPGVGKTSIAQSIAKAMGRKYVRVSLGGVRDEAEIRGHRKTYIGAMPGRIMEAIRQAGVRNPVLLLDEVDKLAGDFRGDPAAALLEVLDSEQNTAFRDHYIELPFDLSEVMFLTTANDSSAIPGPLYDRMDVIELGSYTAEEKFQIVKQHLLTKQLKRHGLTRRTCSISDNAIELLIDGYTREAGVRTLERLIASLCRKAARKIAAGECKTTKITAASIEGLLGPRRYKEQSAERISEIGVVTGLAWTSVGGETMPVEVAVMDGNGKIELTGSLGDVMKESARAAVSYIRAHAKELLVEPDFYKTRDIHLHVPEGAVPKDGPSAGVTIATALVSALTGTPVRADVAMTGEISLRGRVLAIGGLKEKTMAAYRSGVKRVIIPEDNAADLHDLSPLIREKLQFITARHLDTVFEHALVSSPEQVPARLKKEKAVPVPSIAPSQSEPVLRQ